MRRWPGRLSGRCTWHACSDHYRCRWRTCCAASCSTCPPGVLPDLLGSRRSAIGSGVRPDGVDGRARPRKKKKRRGYGPGLRVRAGVVRAATRPHDVVVLVRLRGLREGPLGDVVRIRLRRRRGRLLALRVGRRRLRGIAVTSSISLSNVSVLSPLRRSLCLRRLLLRAFSRLRRPTGGFSGAGGCLAGRDDRRGAQRESSEQAHYLDRWKSHRICLS